jgi:predicted Zn-dependent protease
VTRSPEELAALARAALKACPAKEVEVAVRARAAGNVRFAANGVSTAGSSERISITITAAYGPRSASATTEDPSPDGLARAGRSASDLAKLVPPSPERLPPVKPQSYPRTNGWDATTAAAPPERRAKLAADALDAAKSAGLVAAGFVEDEERIEVFVNSAGAAGVWKGTATDFSTTLRTPDGKQSGWAGASAVKASDIDAAALAGRAAEKAARWKAPVELPPGRYPAVLESAALFPLVQYLHDALDRRRADEGRSAFSAAGGGTRLGEPLFAESLSLVSDPADKKVPASPIAEDGLAAQKLVAIEDGKLVSLVTSRYWAKEKKLAPTPIAGNWVLSAATPAEDLDALIAGVAGRGVLVTRIWYVRMLSPKELTVTGLTRDATFLIEDGRIGAPIKNFRINQSVLDLLRDVEAATAPELVHDGVLTAVPAVRVKALGFSSVSDAV